MAAGSVHPEKGPGQESRRKKNVILITNEPRKPVPKRDVQHPILAHGLKPFLTGNR
jgi:hypothetical protein